MRSRRDEGRPDGFEVAGSWAAIGLPQLGLRLHVLSGTGVMIAVAPVSRVGRIRFRTRRVVRVCPIGRRPVRLDQVPVAPRRRGSRRVGLRRDRERRMDFGGGGAEGRGGRPPGCPLDRPRSARSRRRAPSAALAVTISARIPSTSKAAQTSAILINARSDRVTWSSDAAEPARCARRSQSRAAS